MKPIKHNVYFLVYERNFLISLEFVQAKVSYYLYCHLLEKSIL
jgi:hypothetical protein